MRITLEALQVLDAIDRRGSFAAAAAELHRVPSALTYQVQKLEQELDVLLFDRRGHRAVLTAPGRALLEDGRQLLRAAGELELRVKRLASGWESEVRIAVDNIIDAAVLLPLAAAFLAEAPGTRLRIAYEVLGGTWDALVAGRADLAIGASGDPPPGGGYAVRPIGRKAFVFAVAPGHSLATLPEPLSIELLQAHRAVAAGDTSRSLPPRSVGLLTGQDVLTVPDVRAKVAAQVAGLGCGWLPDHAAAPEVAAGRLVVKQVDEPPPRSEIVLAWRTDHGGKALRWLVRHLDTPEWKARLLAGTPQQPGPRRRAGANR
jgi:DNA-binding transcriptional LysR family regulator